MQLNVFCICCCLLVPLGSPPHGARGRAYPSWNVLAVFAPGCPPLGDLDNGTEGIVLTWALCLTKHLLGTEDSQHCASTWTVMMPPVKKHSLNCATNELLLVNNLPLSSASPLLDTLWITLSKARRSRFTTHCDWLNFSVWLFLLR